LEILVIFILTLINGFFALSEIALVSVKRQRVEQKAQRGHRSAQIVMNLLKNPEDFLSSVQVGITLIGIVSGVYGGATLVKDVQPFIEKLDILKPYAGQLAYVVVIGLITYFSIVIGELIPKTLAMRNAEKVALTVAPIVSVFTKIMYPFVWLLSVSTNLFNRIFGILDTGEENVTEEEIRFMIKTAGKQGVLEKDESELHQNVFTFTAQKARSLMTRRSEIDWLDINDTLANIEKEIRDSNRSKFLVCNGELDKVLGIISVKDFFENKDKPNFRCQDILKEPIYIPENKYLIDVLKIFRQQKQYIGVIIDEYGMIEGIVTLQDLIEPIVGDLPETDDEENDPAIVKREDGSLLVDGGVSIQEINDYLSEDFLPHNDGDYHTVAGFILYELDTLPAVGHSFPYKDRTIEVVDRDGIRIDKILITNAKHD
jgi:putative hemolysin